MARSLRRAAALVAARQGTLEIGLVPDTIGAARTDGLDEECSLLGRLVDDCWLIVCTLRAHAHDTRHGRGRLRSAPREGVALAAGRRTSGGSCAIARATAG